MEVAMDSLYLFVATFVVASALYWFFFAYGASERKGKRAAELSGGSISAEKLQSTFGQYWSFFRRPKEIEKAETVPKYVDTFYDLVTDIFEWGWGQSFHFAPALPGKSYKDATRLHEERAVNWLDVKRGDQILDVGCGVGGPMRAIASHSKANVVGITINEYQVQRAQVLNKKAGLDSLCEVVCGNFLEMPFPDNSFNGAYAIEATCHAPKLEQVYGEVYRVLKPGARFVAYELVRTDLYDPGDSEHIEVIQGIQKGNALPEMRSYSEIQDAARKVGFEIVQEKDLGKPPARPWWGRLKMGRIAYWRNHVMIIVLTWLGIAPKGVVEVHDMLFVTADYIVRGGESGIYSPMYMIVCKKPENQS